MAVYVSGGGSFETPPAGIHNAVCVDVIDLGEVQGQYGPQHRIRLVWEIGALQQSGKRFLIFGTYAAYLGGKSRLHAHLKQWRGGKDFTPEQLAKFDLEVLAGKPCILVVSHESKGDKVYANVTAISPVPQGQETLKPSGDYKRRQSGPPATNGNGQPPVQPATFKSPVPISQVQPQQRPAQTPPARPQPPVQQSPAPVQSNGNSGYQDENDGFSPPDDIFGTPDAGGSNSIPF